MKKKIILISSIVLALCFTTLAVYNLSGMKDIPELRKEMMSYFKTNIIPVLKAQRAKLDAELSEAELQKVDELRAQLKEFWDPAGKNFYMMRMFHGPMHFRMHKHNMECDKYHKAPGDKQSREQKFHKMRSERWKNMTEEQKQKMQEMKDKFKAVIEEAEKIADDHKTTIDQCLTEIKPDLEQWKNDIHEIVKKYIDIDEEKMERFHKHFADSMHHAARGKCQGHDEADKFHGHHMPNGPGHIGMLKKVFSPAGFVLIDFKMLEEQENVLENTTNNTIEMKVFPNPSLNTNNIEYTVKEAGKVTISLLDSRGNVREVILDEEKEPGTYTKEIVISDLKEGVYYYKIQSNSQTVTERFVVNK